MEKIDSFEIIVTGLIIIGGLATGAAIGEYAKRNMDYLTRGDKVPCDVPNRELVFARALNRACSKLDKGHESSCMAKLIEDAVDESNKSCK